MTHPLPIIRRAMPLTVQIKARLRGPGGLYNLGNALGLISGISLALITSSGMQGPMLSHGFDTVVAFLVGSKSAISLTLAMLIFFWSGEMYHRAWADPNHPDFRLVRLGDISSGIAAILLGAGLLILNHPVLAATAGGIHAMGKFGSAFLPGTTAPMWPASWPNFWRTSVAASRLPAMLAAISQSTIQFHAGDLIGLAGTLTLLLCYLVWLRADLLFLE